MSHRDKSSTDCYVEYMEYQHSRADIEGGIGCGSECGHASYSGPSEVLRSIYDVPKYGDEVFGGTYHKKFPFDEEVMLKLVLDGIGDVCQAAIEQHDWAHDKRDLNEELITPEDSWHWMSALYEREYLSRRPYRAEIFGKCSMLKLPIARLKFTAEQGNVYSQTRLGELFYYTLKPSLGGKMAAEWYRRAAEAGWAEAEYLLGNCYYEGAGVEQSEEQATVWWLKADRQGYGEAQLRLGYHWFRKGEMEQAFDRFLRAANQGIPIAQAWLGICYQYGYGAAPNREKAVEWFRKAGTGGVMESYLWLQKYTEIDISGHWKYAEARYKAERDRRIERCLDYRQTIAQCLLAHVRGCGKEEDIKRLGDRGTISKWVILIAIILFIGGCHLLF